MRDFLDDEFAFGLGVHAMLADMQGIRFRFRAHRCALFREQKKIFRLCYLHAKHEHEPVYVCVGQGPLVVHSQLKSYRWVGCAPEFV